MSRPSSMAVFLAFFVLGAGTLAAAPAELSGGDPSFYEKATRSLSGSAQYTLLATGNARGWYAPCGCVSGQAGGLARRVALDQLIDLANPGQAWAWVDAGSAVTPETGEIATLKSRAVYAGMGELGTVAANVAHAETTAGLERVREWGLEFSVPQVSASLVYEAEAGGTPGEEGESPWPASITVPLGGGRVGFVGLMAHSPERTFRLGERTVRTRPAQEALAAGLKAARGQGAEHVVLLAALTIDEVEALLAEQSGVDVVMGASGSTLHQRRTGGVELSWVGARGRFVVEAAVGAVGPVALPLTGVRADGGLPVRVRYHHLKDNYPSHPAGLALEGATRRAINELGQARAAAAVAAKVEQPQVFAGVTSCRSCHVQEYLTWERSGHAKAMKPLVEAGAEFNPECTSCHSTGPAVTGGFRSLLETPELGGVQCEACHGPGLDHATKGVKMTRSQPLGQQLCVRCHDADNSPDFDHALYWPKIAHGAKVTRP